MSLNKSRIGLPHIVKVDKFSDEYGDLKFNRCATVRMAHCFGSQFINSSTDFVFIYIHCLSPLFGVVVVYWFKRP